MSIETERTVAMSIAGFFAIMVVMALLVSLGAGIYSAWKEHRKLWKDTEK